MRELTSVELIQVYGAGGHAKKAKGTSNGGGHGSCSDSCSSSNHCGSGSSSNHCGSGSSSNHCGSGSSSNHCP